LGDNRPADNSINCIVLLVVALTLILGIGEERATEYEICILTCLEKMIHGFWAKLN